MRKLSLYLIFLVALAETALAHDYQVVTTAIGDSRIVTLGGYTWTKPVCLNLAPTNVLSRTGEYALRCRVVYVDGDYGRPTEDEYATVAGRSGLINSWLAAFVAAEYAGAECRSLLKSYYSGDFATDLNDRFPRYVRARIEEMDAADRPNVEIVTVTVEAAGALRIGLAALYDLDRKSVLEK